MTVIKNEPIRILKRRFLGKLTTDDEKFQTKRERAFEKNHLKAYILGKFRFKFGVRKIGNYSEPIYHDVKQEYYEET